MASGPRPKRVRRLGLDIVAALGASHRAGVLHRDIKPGDVPLTADGTAKVGDFGIAKDNRWPDSHRHRENRGYRRLPGPRAGGRPAGNAPD